MARITKPRHGDELVFAMGMRNLEGLCEEELLSLLITCPAAVLI